MEQLGIQLPQLITQVVNFTVLLVILTKLLYQPILKNLEKRRREISDGVALTEKLRQEEEKLAAKADKLLSQARYQARQALDEAKSQAKEAEKEILAAAQREGEEIVAKASADAQRIHEGLAPAIRKEAAELAAAMVKRLLSGALSAKDQHQIITRHLRQLSSAK